MSSISPASIPAIRSIHSVPAVASRWRIRFIMGVKKARASANFASSALGCWLEPLACVHASESESRVNSNLASAAAPQATFSIAEKSDSILRFGASGSTPGVYLCPACCICSLLRLRSAANSVSCAESIVDLGKYQARATIVAQQKSVNVLMKAVLAHLAESPLLS